MEEDVPGRSQGAKALWWESLSGEEVLRPREDGERAK